MNMGGYIDLLTSLPKTKRDISKRAEAKDAEVVAIAKHFGYDYFDGDRKYGYGGYVYDGRWKPVAKDIIDFFKLKDGDSILDIGCGKGFLLYDLEGFGKFKAHGLDISEYALTRTQSRSKAEYRHGTAEKLPYEDKSFDLVISINTIHNLPREGVVRALQEIERVCRGNSYIVVDSYHSQEEKELFESWVLTAEFYGYPEEWLSVFKEAGYTGFYSWNIL